MFTKRYLKSGKVKVEFTLPDSVAADAQTAYVVGDFNNWNEKATPMTKYKNGKFKATLDLEPNREYQFRYFINGKQWHNDSDSGRYVANPFSGDNSVLNTSPDS